MGQAVCLTELGRNHQALQEAETAGPVVESLGLASLTAEAAYIRALALRRLGDSETAAALLDEFVSGKKL